MSSEPTPGWTMLGMLVWLAAVLTLFLLGGCAPVVIKNGWQDNDLMLFLKADLFPAMEKVRDAYPKRCLWGECKDPVPNLAGYSDGTTTRVAAYAPYRNTITVNLYRLGRMDLGNERHVLVLRAIMAHEMGHWILRHVHDYGKCKADRVSCEIEANQEAVRIMGIAWGIDRAEAIEAVWGLVANVYTTAQGGHDNHREGEAFRTYFRCTDQTLKRCLPGGA